MQLREDVDAFICLCDGNVVACDGDDVVCDGDDVYDIEARV